MLSREMVFMKIKSFCLMETENMLERARTLSEHFWELFLYPLDVPFFVTMGTRFSNKGNLSLSHVPVQDASPTSPPVYQLLSPNDNHHHGAAKAKWRKKCAEEGWGPEDSVESELFLLGCLTHTSPEAVRGYFTKIMFMDRTPPRAREIMTRVCEGVSRKKSRDLFFHDCEKTFSDIH